MPSPITRRPSSSIRRWAGPIENRGAAYERKGDIDKAIADFTKAVEVNPKSARAYDFRGALYSKRNERDLAIADFEKAIAINPKYVNAYNNRGIVYGRKGEIEKAIADYTTAMEIDPKYTWAYNNRGLAYGRKGEIDKALADFDKAIELDPEVRPGLLPTAAMHTSRRATPSRRSPTSARCWSCRPRKKRTASARRSCGRVSPGCSSRKPHAPQRRLRARSGSRW